MAVNIHLRDFDQQLIVAQIKAQNEKKDQVIYTSKDKQRYEIFLIATKETFTGRYLRVVRYTGEDLDKAVLSDIGVGQHEPVGDKPKSGKGKSQRKDK